MSSSYSGAERLKDLLTTYGLKETKLPPWGLLSYIKPTDFKNPTKMHPVFLFYLESLRWEASRLAGENIPIFITSDFRAGDDKTHGTDPCVGADVRCRTSRERFFLLQAAFNIGIKRIGIYCDDLHLHFDIGDLIYGSAKWPTEVAWVRECGK